MSPAAGASFDAPAVWTDRATLRRLVRDLLADQRSLTTRRAISAADVLAWSDETRLDEEGIGFDSLGLLEAASRANELFHLHEVGLEDYLLIRRTLGGWLDIISHSLGLKTERVTFRTSGSTGEPKRCVHDLSTLREEVSAHAGDLLRRGARRILSLVPAHHIYGFLFTALLPAEAQLPLVDARNRLFSLGRLLTPGDVVIGTPFLWSLVVGHLGAVPAGVIGVTSTAPMPRDLGQKLIARGLHSLIEVYGSSETAGIGVRSQVDQPFRLLPYWHRDGEGLRRFAAGDPTAGMPVTPPDELAWYGPHNLLPVRRTDGAVQVGGVNVHPQHIADVLATHPDVEACHVGRAGSGADARLVALVVPRSTAASDLAAALEWHATDRLSAPERPSAYRLVACLPRNEMGKIVFQSDLDGH